MEVEHLTEVSELSQKILCLICHERFPNLRNRVMMTILSCIGDSAIAYSRFSSRYTAGGAKNYHRTSDCIHFQSNSQTSRTEENGENESKIMVSSDFDLSY